MALTKCKECGKEVSKNAKICPNCGVKYPGITTKAYILGLVILAGIIWGISQCISINPEKDSTKSIAAQTMQQKNKIEISYTLPAGLPEINESILIKSVGLPITRKYKLDDGHGIKFRKEEQPEFTLEFRAGRVNVGWSEFSDEPQKFGKLNEENNLLAEKVLSVALGPDLAKKISEYKKQQQPMVIKTTQSTIFLSVSTIQTLVTISYK